MEIKVYSLPSCPRCMVLKSKLQAKGIEYEEISSEEILIEKGFMTVPVLQIDDKYYQFGEAVKVINELEDNK